MKIKKLITVITGALIITSCNSGSTTTSDGPPNSVNWPVNDYGYAKYTISPYSGTLAVISYNTESGAMRLASSNYKAAFYNLTTHYSPQSNILSCGIASGVIILNTVYANIGKQPPQSKIGSWYIPEDQTVEGNFTWTEDNFFNTKVNSYLDRSVIYGRSKVNGQYEVGITLTQLTQALNLQGLQAESFPAESSSDADIEDFRTVLRQIMTAPVTEYMIVNYNLNVMSALNGGHFSPIGAYDQVSDSVLILDTWNAFAPWTWVKVYDLYKSMNTLDGTNYRGYILINANNAT